MPKDLVAKQPDDPDRPGPLSGRTRERILREAMRLFGELGYEPTTIAQIEGAAGLSPGSGGLYRHFRSKEQVLREGVLAQVASVADLAAFIDDPDGLAQMPIRAQLAALARAGLRRMDSKRDLNRILHRRDLPHFRERVRYLAVREQHPCGGTAALYFHLS